MIGCGNKYIAANIAPHLQQKIVAEFKFNEASGGVFGNTLNASQALTGVRNVVAGIEGNAQSNTMTANTALRQARHLYFTQQNGSQIDDVPFVWSFWYKRSTQTNTGLIFISFAGNGQANSHYQVQQRYNTTRGYHIVFVLSDNEYGYIYLVQYFNIPDDNDFHHICFTYNGNKNAPILKSYLDGQDVNSPVISSGTGYTGMNSVSDLGTSVLQQLNGAAIDLLQVFKFTDINLSDQIAQYLYNNGAGRQYPFT